MLSALLMRSSNMPFEIQEILLQNNQSNNWSSQLQPNRTSPHHSDPGTTCSSLDESYFRHHNLIRSSSVPDPDTWRESSPTDFRSQVKAGKSERYKTELCRSFEETGFCKYKEKCQFAHGSSELRNVPRHPKYKTDRCRTYHSTGFCPYGSRCHFIHAEQTTSHPGHSSRPEVDPLSRKNDFRLKVSEAERDAVMKSQQRVGGMTAEQFEQFLEAFNHVLLAISTSSQTSQSPSPNFEVTPRLDSVTSCSLVNSPSPTSSTRDDIRSLYSRIPSRSSDFDGHGYAIHSPVSPTTPFFSDITNPSAFMPFGGRIPCNPLSYVFDA